MHASSPDLPHPSLILPATAEPDVSPPAALVVDVRDGNGRRLLATAEPVEPTAAGEIIARQALASLRRAFLFAADASLAEALDRAFAAANREVQENNAWPNAAVSRRVLVGVTAAVIEERDLVIGLVPPGQAIVVQDGRLFAFPELASWRPDFETDGTEVESEPLGCSDGVKPVLYATVIAPGDALLIGSAGVGRYLASSPRAADLAAHPEWVPAFVSRAGRSGHRLGCAAWLTIAAERASDTGDVPGSASSPQGCDAFTTPDALVGPGLGRAILIDRLQTRAIEFFERLAPVSNPPSLPLEPARRAALPPGAEYVQRYGGYRRHDRSPWFMFRDSRTARMPLRGRAVAVLLTILVMLSGLYAGYDRRQARASRAEDYLSAIDAYVAAIATSRDPAAIDGHLDEAEAALAAAERSGAPVSLLRSRQEAVAAARDRSGRVTRLSDVRRLGTLPADVDRGSLRLVGDAERLFVVADAIYQVDVQSGTLLLLLAPGWTVGNRTVGSHLDAAYDGDVLVVSDGATLFRLGPDGVWDISRIGSSDERGEIDVSAYAAFAGSYYEVDAVTGDIWKFAAELLSAGPTQLLKNDETRRPESAVDIVIDGSIFVLGAEGEVFEYRRGALRDSFRPAVEPAIAEPIALIGGSKSDDLYLVDTNGTEGRIVLFDRNGGGARQLKLPVSWQNDEAATAVRDFAQVRDVVVDEAAGTIMFVGNDALWQASFPTGETAI